MTALQRVTEIEARKAEHVAAKQAFDNELSKARLAGGTTAAMRARARELQLAIEACNRELAQAERQWLSMSAGTELLPCPFCGSAAALTYDVFKKGFLRDGVAPKLWYVVCVNKDCKCRLAAKFGPTDAVRLWQQRSVTEARGSALTCQMERISREGLCGKPATHKWHTKDGYILVCDDCLMGINLCGGNLTPIATAQES